MSNSNNAVEDFRNGAVWGAASFPAELFDYSGKVIKETGASIKSKPVEDMGAGLIATGNLVRGIMSKMFWEAASAENAASDDYKAGKRVGAAVSAVMCATPTIGAAGYLISRML